MNELKPIEPLILTLRGQRVILDADLAKLYGVQTKVLNQAVKRNAERFPEDFIFQVTSREWRSLRGQFSAGSPEVIEQEVDAPNRFPAAP